MVRWELLDLIVTLCRNSNLYQIRSQWIISHIMNPNLVIIERGQTARKQLYNSWQRTWELSITTNPSAADNGFSPYTSFISGVFLGKSGSNFLGKNRTKTPASCISSISKLRPNQWWERGPGDSYHGNVIMSRGRVSEEVQKRTSCQMIAFPYRAWV